MASGDKREQRFGEQQSDDDIEGHDHTVRSFEAVGQRPIIEGEPERNKKRDGEPLPMSSELHFDALAAASSSMSPSNHVQISFRARKAMTIKMAGKITLFVTIAAAIADGV